MLMNKQMQNLAKIYHRKKNDMFWYKGLLFNLKLNGSLSYIKHVGRKLNSYHLKY